SHPPKLDDFSKTDRRNLGVERHSLLTRMSCQGYIPAISRPSPSRSRRVLALLFDRSPREDGPPAVGSKQTNCTHLSVDQLAVASTARDNANLRNNLRGRRRT